MADKKIKQPIRVGLARVPVMVQLEALECGAACLCMILAYYSKWVPLEQVRTDCGVSRDGARASHMLKAARSYGLEAQGYRYEPAELKAEGCFPCIVHWNFNHFVVLRGFAGGKAYLNDPAKGECAVSMEQFDQAFTGVCLLFQPGEDFVPDGKRSSTWRFVKKRMAGAGVAVACVVTATVITSLLGIVNPAFTRIFIDHLLTGGSPDWFYPFMLALGLLTAITLLVTWIQVTCAIKLHGKMAISANASFLWHVLRLPMSFFSQRMAGDIAMRQVLNEEIANTFISAFAPLVIQTAMMVFYLVAMVGYSPLLAAVGVASILINLVMGRIISHKRVNVTRVLMRDFSKLAGTTVAGIEMIETIKASGGENGFYEKWAGYQAGVAAQTVRCERISRYLGMIPRTVSAISAIVVLMLGVYLTMQGQFTPGMILAFQGFMVGFTNPAQSLIVAGQIIQEMRTNMERIEDVMESPTDVSGESGYDENQVYTKLTGEVVMREVSFGYSPLEPPLIQQFSLRIKPGSWIALVGTSGCGKSTLSKLISGLYQPWSGEILFDGKPATAIDHSIFTSSMAVVDQEIILFEDTIGNNIKMWDTSIEDFEAILAARDASLHGDIMERVGGYDCKLMEGGKNLSGGQRQRMEIARVLAQDPTIVILDEATSALDAETEFAVVNAIRSRGITCIVIAHRLSTIRDCDEILVMDKGRVVERGTHETLYQMGGMYKELVTNE